ncbi:MAG: ATP-binding protein [Pirellulaceae bacterium]
MARVVKRNGEHLLNVINDIRDLSKIEAGKFEVLRMACSPGRVASEVVSTMKVQADAKALPLTLEYQGPIPESVQTDPLRLRQILINLVGNAIKFTEVGSVRVVMRLNANANADGASTLTFDVVDTGFGMSQEQLGQLFQPFSQVDTSATPGQMAAPPEAYMRKTGLVSFSNRRQSVAASDPGSLSRHVGTRQGSAEFLLPYGKMPLLSCSGRTRPHIASKEGNDGVSAGMPARRCAGG